MMYRTKMQFVRANAVKRKTKVQTSDGETIAEAGDYVVTFPNEARTVMKKDFFESWYEDAESTVFCDICLDFDGVLHSYVSGWQGASIIPDPPAVEGFTWILRSWLAATPPLKIAVHSARSAQADGIQAMHSWIEHHDAAERGPDDEPIVNSIAFPYHKPAAKVYIDDRGFRFEGKFPNVDNLISMFSTWNESQKLGKQSLLLPNNGGLK